jgi:hypothetical protein
MFLVMLAWAWWRLSHQAITYPQSLSPNQLTGAKKQHQPSPSKSAKQHN